MPTATKEKQPAPVELDIEGRGYIREPDVHFIQVGLLKEPTYCATCSQGLCSRISASAAQ